MFLLSSEFTPGQHNGKSQQRGQEGQEFKLVLHFRENGVGQEDKKKERAVEFRSLGNTKVDLSRVKHQTNTNHIKAWSPARYVISLSTCLSVISKLLK